MQTNITYLKKYMSLFLCFTICFISVFGSFMTFSYASEDNVEISINGGAVNENGEYAVTIDLANYEKGLPAGYDGLFGLSFVVTYDSRYFEPKPVEVVVGYKPPKFEPITAEKIVDVDPFAEDGALIQSYDDLSVNADVAGEIGILFTEGSNDFSRLITKDGKIGTIIFKVKDGVTVPDGQYAVSFKTEPRTVTYFKNTPREFKNIENVTFKGGYITVGEGGIVVDKSALEAKLTEANNKKNAAVVGTEPGQYPQDAYNAFSAAIEAAQVVYDNANATQEEVDAAVAALATAIATFESSVISSNNVEISINGGTLSENGECAVTIDLANYEKGLPAGYDGLFGLSFVVTYDSRYFEPKPVEVVVGYKPPKFEPITAEKIVDVDPFAEDGALIQSYDDLSVNADVAGEIGILFTEGSNDFSRLITKDGKIGTIIFKVKDGVTVPDGQYAVSFKTEPRTVTYFKNTPREFKNIENVTFKGGYITVGEGGIVVDKSALEAKLTEANNKKNAAVVGTEPGQYPQDAYNVFSAAIEVAQAVYDNANATQEEVDAAVATLAAAIKAFEDSVVPVPSESKKIISVTYPDMITVPNGTYFADLNLPEKITVTLEDETTKELGVEWDPANYIYGIPGTYQLEGEIVLTSGVSNPQEYKALILVKVLPPVRPQGSPVERGKADVEDKENVYGLEGKKVVSIAVPAGVSPSLHTAWIGNTPLYYNAEKNIYEGVVDAVYAEDDVEFLVDIEANVNALTIREAGDVDGKDDPTGKPVSAKDVEMTVRLILNIITDNVYNRQTMAADMNGDRKIDIFDIVAMIEKYVNYRK